MNKSIYRIEKERNKEVCQRIEVMKIIMVKGIGYLVVSENFKVTAETMFNIACSMERQNIQI